MPELIKPPATPYLTVIPGRRPEQKVHKRLSDAKNAFDTPRANDKIKVPYGALYYNQHTHGWGQLYEWVDGEWSLLLEVPQPSVITDKYPYHEDTRPWRTDA